MKSSLFLVVILAVYAANAVPVDDFPKQPYSRYVKYTDENGDLKTIDLEEEPDMDLLNRISRNPDDNLYLLFTRSNPNQGQVLEYNNAESVKNSNFNPENQVVVLVHGWLSNQESGMNGLITNAYLNKGDYNVIVLDWRNLALSNYVTSARGVPEVGRGLGRFLRFLNQVSGASYDNMHLVGFSLGAHLVGNAGRELNGKVARITALDPAGPLWNINSDKISSDDAQYVEGIHTDGGLEISLGIGYAVGDADFFPNGGNEQPGCLSSSICSHNRAWRFFAASVSYDHLEARGCSGYVQMFINFCRGERLNMGNGDLSKRGSGLYRGSTRRRYPY